MRPCCSPLPSTRAALISPSTQCGRREKKSVIQNDLLDIFASAIMKPTDSEPFDASGMSSIELEDEIKRLRHQLDVNRVRHHVSI